MGKSKWEKFHSSHSPIVINKPNTGGSVSLKGDWHRELGQQRMTINGKPLEHPDHKVEEKYNNFHTDEDVKRFFKEVILKDIQDEANKEQMVAYLATAFHQGGMMYPVKSSLSKTISTKIYLEDGFSFDSTPANVNDADTESIINIQTTPTGFKIQEISTFKALSSTPDTPKHYFPKKERSNLISPDEGKDFVLKAQGTIDVNLTKNTNSPEITIESNTISYGHAGLEQLMDKRTILERFVDFIKRAFGVNEVKVAIREDVNQSKEVKLNEELPSQTVTSDESLSSDYEETVSPTQH